jgi:hypothetical protein
MSEKANSSFPATDGDSAATGRNQKTKSVHRRGAEIAEKNAEKQ